MIGQVLQSKYYYKLFSAKTFQKTINKIAMSKGDKRIKKIIKAAKYVEKYGSKYEVTCFCYGAYGIGKKPFMTYTGLFGAYKYIKQCKKYEKMENNKRFTYK